MLDRSSVAPSKQPERKAVGGACYKRVIDSQRANQPHTHTHSSWGRALQGIPRDDGARTAPQDMPATEMEGAGHDQQGGIPARKAGKATPTHVTLS